MKFSELKNMKLSEKLSIVFLIVALISIPFFIKDLKMPDVEIIGGIEQDKESNAVNLVDPSISSDSSFIYDTQIDTLLAEPQMMDGRTVQIEGEVIGDRRNVDFDNKHYWISVQETTAGKDSCITVFVSDLTTRLIDTYGAYQRRGTKLQIRGTFHLACPDHDGLCDIHAESSSVVDTGFAKTSDFNFDRLIDAFCLFGIAFLLTLSYILMRDKSKKRNHLFVDYGDVANEANDSAYLIEKIKSIFKPRGKHSGKQ